MTETTGKPAAPWLHDHEARTRIAEDLERTLFVEAGAGSGKTTALVDRVLALIGAGVDMENIAAITFTEKAAAELRDRVRRKLEQVVESTPEPTSDSSAPSAGLDPAEALAALQQLDGAAVGTLHSFAQRILAEHPTEAGLPPRVEVVDEIGSQVEFDDRWRNFVESLVDDPVAGVSLLVLELSGAGLDKLRGLAVKLNENWDLAEERIDRSLDPPDPDAVGTAEVKAALRTALAHRPDCTETEDGLLRKLDEMDRRSDGLSSGDGISRLAAVTSVRDAATAPIPRGTSYTAHWLNGSKVVKEAVTAAATACDAVLGPVTQAALEHIVALLTAETLAAAEQRRVAGRLEFQDLLVRARRLLRHPEQGPAVRSALRDSYRRLLLDESQDTDPIQIELAVLIACTDHAVGDTPWHELTHQPGRLFLVGDPKQSIYRFRRADIATFLRAGQYVEDQPHGERLELFTNFRSTAPVIEWVNAVFGQVISAAGDSQPSYVPLAGVRSAARRGPGVAVVGAEPIEGTDERKINADRLRRLEAAAVADAVARALDDGWEILDEKRSHTEVWRPAEPGDIAILLPARTSLEALEEALDAAGISYRAETSTLVYGTREVRDLLLAAQAVSDPTDELALVATLRSPLYGCGDDDLAHWKLGCQGRFSLLDRRQPDAEASHPVAEGLAHLRAIHDARWWLTPAQLLERIIRQRAVLESAVATGRPRDVWRRLRFVVDQARAWADAGGTGLRPYLRWARLQGADNARVTETVLPETDDDSVRILTIHGAKGLQFPITVVSGMSSLMQRPSYGPTIAFPPGQPAVARLSTHVASEGYEQWQPIDEMMDEHERRRLLYVACTRARDHLVVSLHRTAEGRLAKGTLAAELTAAGAAQLAEPLEPGPRAARPATAPAPEAAPAPRDQWLAERTETLARASRRLVTSATALAGAAVEGTVPEPAQDLSTAPAGRSEDDHHHPRHPEQTADPGLLKDERDAALPPWNKGRYGTAVGRAVHGVLQTVALHTGAGLEQLARAQAMAEGVPDRAAAVTGLARAALNTEVAREAAASDHWRELFVAAPLGGQVVEGYVDLVYRRADGLVVVDWKTDAVAGDDDIDSKLARYRLQGAAYVAALEAATGEPVARMVFVFLDRAGAIEAPLPDLRAAVNEARAAADRLSA